MNLKSLLILVLTLNYSFATTNPYEIEMKNIFETLHTYYAPWDLKKETIRLDWVQLENNAMSSAASVQKASDFYFAVADLFNSFNDAHVSVGIPSSLVYTLPVQFSAVENKVIVSYINRSEILSQLCPLNIGDVLDKFNGKTIDELMLTQNVFRKYGNDITNKMYFVRMLSKLSQEKGIRLESFNQANIELTQTNGQNLKCIIPYKKSGVALIDKDLTPSSTQVTDELDPSIALAPLSFESQQRDTVEFQNIAQKQYPEECSWCAKLLKSQSFEKISKIMSMWHKLLNLTTATESSVKNVLPTNKVEGRYWEVGYKDATFPLPANFKTLHPTLLKGLIVSYGTSFRAGTFKRNGKKIGYLRIPDYMPRIAYFAPFSIRYLISELEKKSDLLIIDQMNNPGGAVVLSDLLVKGLVGNIDPSIHMKFRVKPTQNFLRTFAEIYQNVQAQSAVLGDPKSPKTKYFNELFDKNYKAIYKAYVKGETLSEPVALYGMSEFLETAVDKIANQIPLHKLFFGKAIFKPQVYTKPVYFLINELDFSGGDATPAILQDYGRAKLIGVRTAGAGGSVEEFTSKATSDIKFRLTTSLMYRKDGKLVENYGVQPDVAFNLTVEDYRTNFAGTLDRLLKQLSL